ncbi:Pentatricopeptide repeat-containing protein [Zea mays]|uniref:Pentatricopeptide repeat-containing protein n=1 Tax=Zea mays TaxID=4577 RepID=A0A1D6GCT4_MAIZE|nr:Pentatricopeptide repeat-containing protein [Zea mays]
MGSGGIRNARPSSWLAAVAAAAAPPIAHAVLLTSGHLSSRASANSLLRVAPCSSACALILRLLLLHRLRPDHISLSFSLHACARVVPTTSRYPLTVTGLLHSLALRLGHARDVYVANAAVSSYFAASDVASADRLFAEVSTDVADVVTWTTMVTGHASAGGLGRARHFFDAMSERNVVSWNAMLSAYARAGMLTEARDLFDAMPTRNAATWSCMISGLVLSGRCWEALGLFGDMVHSSGIVPNEPALVSVVSACAQMRSLEHGAWVHAYAEQELQGAMSVVLASAIIDMYGKCGGIHSAIRVFAAMPMRNIYSWNAMITGLAMNGGERQALSLLWKMQMVGVQPNDITFIGLLSACTHSGLVNEGRRLFDSMIEDFGIQPFPQHYGLMVDLIGRSGRVMEALYFVKSMPVEPHPGLWGALASACKMHGKVELGEEVAKKLIELEPRHGSRYILLSNFGSKPSYLGVQKSPPSLALCPATNNCVSTSEEISDSNHYAPPWNYNPKDGRSGKPITKEEAMKELIEVFVDDVEFWFPPGNKTMVQYRSASRSGFIDFNANKKRVKELRLALEKKGWASESNF